MEAWIEGGCGKGCPGKMDLQECAQVLASPFYGCKDSLGWKLGWREGVGRVVPHERVFLWKHLAMSGHSCFLASLRLKWDTCNWLPIEDTLREDNLSVYAISGGVIMWPCIDCAWSHIECHVIMQAPSPQWYLDSRRYTALFTDQRFKPEVEENLFPDDSGESRELFQVAK